MEKVAIATAAEVDVDAVVQRFVEQLTAAAVPAASLSSSTQGMSP
jgi:hypothetical protein